MLRKNNLLLLLFLTITVSLAPNAHGKRYITPNDSNILLDIGQPSSRAELNPDDVKVLVWNMYKGDKPTWERDYKNLSRGMDILMLQEIYLDYNMSKVLYEDSRRGYNVATAWVDTKNRNAPSGVGTASHITPVNVDYHQTHYREPLIKTHKMAIFVEYPIGGSNKTLLTANLHAINFVSARKLDHMLRAIEDVIKAHDGPAILGGDFNVWSKKKTKYMMRMARRAGMSEVKFSPDTRMKTFGKALDYVFTKGLSVGYSKVYGSVEGSDHKALEVHFSINTNKLSRR